MPRPVVYIALFLVALTLVPLGLLVRDMSAGSKQPRIQVVPDMDQQPRYRTQMASDLFADGRVMRLPVAGTVALAEEAVPTPFHTGRQDTTWTTEFPVEVTLGLLERGQERFELYCSGCHGLTGTGEGIVGIRAAAIGEASWVPPSDLTSDLVVDRPVGHIFGSMTYGIRFMPSHAAQITTEDRWAIVAYVRALQRSVHGTIDDVPADSRKTLR